MAQVFFSKDGSFLFSVDTVLSESHDITSTITDVPVETGANINDNIVLNPDIISIEIATDTFRDLRNTGKTKKDIWQDLLAIRISRELFDIQTELDFYEDMQIESLSSVDSSGTEDIMQAIITCKRIVLVESQTEQRLTETPSPEVEKLTQPQVDGGRQPAEPVL